ncbi:MAG TPA: hypothetical protein VHU82_00785 [Vicinamibacterales bacterium]|nr:hypothetical protein [Vicinamibacterales bacterium]
MHRTYVGLFLIALVTLVVEVLLTRIFDVLLWPNVSFMIISCALFGLGLGGLYDVLEIRGGDALDLSGIALLFGVSVWALPLLLNAVPFSVDRIAQEPVAQVGCFLALYLILLAPFFFAGLCICRLFSAAASDIQRLYFWDLSGAAVGSALLIPLLRPLGPERLLQLAAVAALVASALLSNSRQRIALLATVATAFAVLPAALGGRYTRLALHQNKRDVESSIALGQFEVSTWDPVSQISVIDQPSTGQAEADHGKKHVAYDGGTQSSNFYPFDGDFAALRRELPRRLKYQFWQRGVLAAHYLRRDTGHTALIIGSAGGQETKAALLYGASDIDAVEMVRTVVELATGPYANYIGRIFERPEVHLHVGEGRSFLRASGRTYDVIQIFSNYTSSSAAAGSGALSPMYLQTVEAYRDYFEHLKADGILQINHHTYPRMIATAAAAWRALGRDDFRSHVVVVERQQQERQHPDYLPTMLIKMSPWTAAEVADVERFFSFEADGEPAYRIVENPLAPAASFLPAAFYSGVIPESLRAAAPFAVTPVTDDRPTFDFLRRSWRMLAPDRRVGLNLSTAAFLDAELRGDGWLPMDWLHLMVASAASIFYGLVFVLAPMYFTRVGREPWEGKGPALLYFSLLGFGFIALEILLIQIFMKIIGYPLYAVATVITVMLVGAGVGSMASQWVVGRGAARWRLSFGGTIVAGLTLWILYPAISSHVIAAAMPVRIAAATAMIFPLAFFMGMPFPLGILELAGKPRGAVAWAWSMNGLCSTIGSVATVLLSLWLGLRITVLVALLAYAGAAAAYGALRRASERLGSAAPRPYQLPSLASLPGDDGGLRAEGAS